MNRKSQEHLEWIREQPCACCGAEYPSEPHHFIGEGGLSGMGLKAPDIFAIPVCRLCHGQFHQGVKGWKQAQQQAMIDTLFKAFKEGKIGTT